MTTTVTNPKNNQTIESAFSFSEAIVLLQSQKSDFAQSLLKQYEAGERPLSEAQIYWVHKLVQPPESYELHTAQPVKLVQKLGRLMWRMPDKARIKLYLDKDNENQIKVFHSGGDSTRYVGYVEGKDFFFRDYCPEIVKTQLYVFSKDPIAFMMAYGKEFGRCMVCGRELENEESVALGIGPICLGRLS